MNICYVNFLLPAENIQYDYFWMSLKSYVEDNFKGTAKFNWSYPLNDSDFDSIDEIIDNICEQQPDILALSLYVWNHALSHEVAKRVKQKRPNTLIVVGGPHQEHSQPDYFLRRPYIDFACETDGYGEVFFNELLYQLTTDRDWNKVPYLINARGRSNAKYNKRDFVWPRKIFERNKDYIQTRLDKAASLNIPINLMYETSRGCPYGCTYCEWGGGTNSKVSFKPTEYVFEDLDFLIPFTKPTVIGTVDANFGIVERDIDIAKLIAYHAKTTGYPKNAYMYGPTKKNKENLYQIEYVFAEAGLTDEFKISVQDLNDDVIKNIKRTDTPWLEQYEVYKNIRKEFGGRIRLELMMGLPGTTVKDYYEALNAMCPEFSFGSRYVWHLLPTTPAAKIEYREKYDIKTIKLKNVWRPEFASQYANKSILLKDTYVEPTNIVVSTNSYTKEEWCEMFIMDRIITSMEVEGFATYISKYVNDVMKIPYSKFYNRMWNSFINNDDYLPEYQQSIYSKIISEVNERVANGFAEDIEHYKMPDSYRFDFYASIIRLNKMAIHIDRNSFYNGMLRWAINEFGEDEGLVDVIKWTANSIMFIDYDPENPEPYETKFNWVKWIDTGELESGVFINTPRDKVRKSSHANITPITWNKYPIQKRISMFFLSLCSEPERYLLFREIEVTHVN